MAAFIADLTRLPASVRLDPFVIERLPGAGRVVLRGRVRAFRYVDDEELASQRGFTRIAASTHAPNLREELRSRSRDLRGRVDPLPTVRLFPRLHYRAAGLSDPPVQSSLNPGACRPSS